MPQAARKAIALHHKAGDRVRDYYIPINVKSALAQIELNNLWNPATHNI